MEISRRAFTLGLGCFIGLATPACAQTRTSVFDRELASILADDQLMAKTQELGHQFDDIPAARGTVRSRSRSDRGISERAIKLIVGFEVTSSEVYAKKYQGITRPGGQSGPTIGIGYDLGYVTPDYMNEDWTGHLPADTLNELRVACGLKGAAAEAMLPQLPGISVPWRDAYAVFRERVLPIYVAATLDSLANASSLSDDSLGALVSLVYNRGASFTASGDRYDEMRRIKRLMLDSRFDLIPDQIERMARLWTSRDVIGVAKRRGLEAQLFREGL